MTPRYRVLISSRARKQMRRLERSDQLRIQAALDLLSTDPRPPRCTSLVGLESSYRVRVGDFRILYTIEDAIRVVAVIRIGHRCDVYR